MGSRQYATRGNIRNQAYLSIERLQRIAITVTIHLFRRLGNLYSTNRQAFANIMMLHELGLVVYDAYNPMINGLVNFIAFVTFGFMPLIPYFVSYYGRNDHESHYLWTMAIGAVELFILGFAKSTLIGMRMRKRFFHGA